MSQHERKILPVLKIIRVCLTTRQTTSGAPIDDLTVESCANSCSGKVAKRLCASLDRIFN